MAHLHTIDPDVDSSRGGRHEWIHDGFLHGSRGNIEGEEDTDARVGDQKESAGGAEGYHAVEILGCGKVCDFVRGGSGSAGTVAVHVKSPHRVGANAPGSYGGGEVTDGNVEDVRFELGDATATKVIWKFVNKSSRCFLGGIDLIEFRGVEECGQDLTIRPDCEILYPST